MMVSKVKKKRNLYTGPLQAATSTGATITGKNNTTIGSLSLLASLFLKKAGVRTWQENGNTFASLAGPVCVSGLSLADLTEKIKYYEMIEASKKPAPAITGPHQEQRWRFIFVPCPWLHSQKRKALKN